MVNAGTDQTITLPASASLSGTATDDGLPSPPTLTTTWSKFSGPGTVTFGNANALSTTASFSIDGTYVLRLTADDNALSTTDDVTITVNPGAGALIVTLATPGPTVNLTTEGTLDWTHWGLTSPSSFNRKSGVTAQISNYTRIGTGSVNRVKANPVAFSWTDGTPTASATNTPTGLYIIGVNNGFQITAPADTTDKTLKVYIGLWSARGRMEVTLSDSSAAAFVDTSIDNPSATSVGVYTINYRAGSAGQQLRVRWTMMTSYNSFGNVTLQAATLVSGFSASIFSPETTVAKLMSGIGLDTAPIWLPFVISPYGHYFRSLEIDSGDRKVAIDERYQHRNPSIQ
jgi:hypothetical protein